MKRCISPGSCKEGIPKAIKCDKVLLESQRQNRVENIGESEAISNDESSSSLTSSTERLAFKYYFESEGSFEDCTENGKHINTLPAPALLHVLKYLSLQDLIKRAALVCKRWYNLCFDPGLWRQVRLNGQLRVNDAILERFTRYCPNFTFLDLTDLRLITSAGLRDTLVHCNNLNELYLVRCMQLTDVAYCAIGQNCPRLKSLKLNCCSAISDGALEKIANGCRRLEKLWLNQCGSIRDMGIMAVAKCCPNLKLLALEQCRDVSDEVLEPLAKGCPNLEHLGFMSNDLSENGLKHLAKCRNLRVLDMTQMDGVTDDCVTLIVRNCTNLNTLNLSLCSRITDTAVHFIAQYGVNLRSLYLVACKLTDQALFFLAQHDHKLEKLDVGWCEDVTNVGAEYISKSCSNLQYLGLMRCDRVTKDASERLVQEFPQVTYSTMWLECERLLAKARLAGFTMA